VGKASQHSADGSLARRLRGHVVKLDRSQTPPVYAIKGEKWDDIKEIRTLPFSEENRYLAPALEVFLIGEFKDVLRNKHGT
jgi:hypothetical protein